MIDYNVLNNEQRMAVMSGDGAVLVSAGAGSGKTRVLTYRIAHLILDKDVEPSSICAVTFTNKAANEMKERVKKMLGDKALGVLTCTFHSLCVRILRVYASLLNGYNGNFTIYDENDKLSVIKSIVKEHFINDDSNDKYVDVIFDYISQSKTFYGNKLEVTFPKSMQDICKKALELYDEKLRQNNAFDFDDLLIKTYELLSNYEEARQYYQDKFVHILVDEFQDTSSIQFDIVKILSNKHKNIFVVGDEDQSIYSWRGALKSNMTKFLTEYENVKVYKLEQNYRSTKKILCAANEIIKNNEDRLEKVLWTENNDGVKIENYKANSDDEEANYVARSILSLKTYSSYKNSDFAILVRKNSLTRKFEEKLLNFNIDYRVFGGRKFYDRAEIKNVLAYAKCMVNPADDNSFLRIVNYPKRGIGEIALEKFISDCDGQNYYEHLMKLSVTSDFDSKLLPKFLQLKQVFEKLEDIRNNNGLHEFFVTLIDITGIEQALSNKNDEDANRLDNIKELINSVAEYEKNNENATLSDYIQSVSLIADIDSYDSEADSVTLATVHAVKGLEFKVVFIVALEENVFPLIRQGDCADLEEERRLMYVAITRAMERLYLTYSRTRFVYNGLQYTIPSRFLQELNMVENPKPVIIKSFNDYDSDVEYKTPSSYGFGSSIKSFTTSTVAAKQKKYDKGMKVYHIKFEDGIITDVDESSRSITVLFKRVGVKVLTFDAPLKILN